MKRSRLRKRYGRSHFSSVKKAAWMRSFSDEATRLGAHPGRLAWDDAHYLFNEGVSPFEAARRVYEKGSR
jgi:hypothetical protein